MLGTVQNVPGMRSDPLCSERSCYKYLGSSASPRRETPTERGHVSMPDSRCSQHRSSFTVVQMVVLAVYVCAAAATAAVYVDDKIESLPGYGKLTGKQYAGFAAVTPKNKLHYWFAECDHGNSPQTPLLLWLNERRKGFESAHVAHAV